MKDLPKAAQEVGRKAATKHSEAFVFAIGFTYENKDREATVTSTNLRRLALMVHLETGKSVQEALEEIVSAIQGGRVPFPLSLCPICASARHRITSTKTYIDGIVRYHSCDFCTGNFVSEEKLPVKFPTPEPPGGIFQVFQ